MKEQKLIIESDRTQFDERVNKYLQDGWTVVPKTLKIAVSISAAATRHSNLEYIHIARHAVVLERDND